MARIYKVLRVAVFMQVKRIIEISALAVSGLIVAVAASWLILASFNFSYGFWHDYGGIGPAIEKYAESNRFKRGFQFTTKAQRQQLFEEINSAVHSSGSGLSDIVFRVEGFEPQTLLTDVEVVHLQDVAHMIDKGLALALGVLVFWVCVWLYFALARRRLPGLWSQTVAIGGVLAVGAFIILIIGPVDVFYWLHTVAFPDDHQWFFYYQDSLMSTMMYAPILFGWIALELLLLTLLFFVLFQGVAAKILDIFQFGR